MSRRAVVAAALAAIVLLGGGLRVHASQAARGHRAADENSYLGLAADLRVRHVYGDASMAHPFHWAPGTPALFALAEGVAPSHARSGPFPSAARTAQALAGTLTILAVFGLGAILAGPWAGLVAAAVVALYPPLIDASNRLVSEPLGALTLAVAVLALAWAWRGGGVARFALAGAALGAACLTRADLLLVALVAVAAVGALSVRLAGPRGALLRAGAVLGGALVLVGPWTAYASHREGSFVPITDGATTTLLIGTYLPGQGTLSGFKRAYATPARRLHPSLRHSPAWRIRASAVLDAVAAQHPGLSRHAALRAALRANLRRYALGRPLAFAGMEARKLWRMWGSYYHAGTRATSAWTLWLHRAIALGALAGLLAGLWRTRRPELALALGVLGLATLVNIAFVAEPRHNARLLPVLVACGVAGWALATGLQLGPGEPSRRR
jgi:4-amino-4-deoxy-L-arabinose transferase-like glycosyltransferase